MSRRTLNMLGILILMAITSIVSIFAYTVIIGGSGQASEPITAPTLDLSTPTPDAMQTQLAQLSGNLPAVGTQVAALAETGPQMSTQLAEVNDQLAAIQGTLSVLEANDPALGIATEVADISLRLEQMTDLQQKDATLGALVLTPPTRTPTPTASPTLVPSPTLPPTVTPLPTLAPSLTPPPMGEATVVNAASAAVFRIVPDESEVRFILTEELRGQPATVTGRTNQIAGDILVDTAAPANSRVGTIRINARTLVTDNEFRNRAIRGEILESSKPEYEFSEFTPTALSGLPDQVEVGQEFTFQITGDLKVRDITNAVTFAVTATLVSEDRLEGTATAAVTREDYDLQIPSVPGVANVSDEVQLEIDFVATRVE